MSAARENARLVTERVLGGMPNGELDRLFRASPAGEIPSGRTRGTAMIAPGTWLCGVLAWLTRCLAWRGKVLDPARGDLRNIVSPLGFQAIRALVSVGPSWVDGRECVVIDYLSTSLVARPIRDEIRLVAPHLYLGVVWFGRRRIAWFTLRAPERADRTGGRR
jgi:hypothetical protein